MKKLIQSFLILTSISVPFYVLGYEEEDIPLADVPKIVLEAAYNAWSGITLTEAEKITDNSNVSYELEGTVNKKEIEILISNDGNIISMDEDD